MRSTDPDPESSGERDFIELATRPLEEHPELRDEARGELMGRLSQGLPAGEQREAVLTAARNRLEKSLPRSGMPIIGVAVLLWLFLAGGVAWQATRIYSEFQKETEQIERAEETVPRLQPNDPRLPTNPAEFEEQVAEPDIYSISDGSYHKAWKKVDPDNGAWAWREAEKRSEITWLHDFHHVEDAKTWQLVEEAAKAPHFTIHYSKRRAARLTALGTPETGVGLFVRLGRHQAFPSRSLRTNGPFSYFGDRMVETKDREGLSRGIQVWEKICMRHVGEFSASQDLGIIRPLCTAGDQLTTAAMALGMRGEADKLLRQTTAMAQGDTRHLALSKKHPGVGVMARRNLYLGPSPGSEAYLPGRMMEYALAERLLALMAAALVLLVAAGAGLESLRRTQQVKALALGLAPLFDWSDRAWVIGLGVMLPLLWYGAITRLTPLGARDYPIFDYHYPRILFQAAAVILLMLVLTVQTVLWRISRRAAFLDLASRPSWLGWVIVAIAMALLPLTSFVHWPPTGQLNSSTRIVAGCAGLPLLWLLWHAGATLIAPSANALRGAILARTILPPLLTAATLLLALHSMLLANEKNWMAKDELTAWDAARGMSKQEAKSIDWIAARCREAFGNKPSASPLR